VTPADDSIFMNQVNNLHDEHRYPQTYYCRLVQEDLFILADHGAEDSARDASESVRARVKGSVPKRRSTRCPRHLNSANRELDLRELSHVEAGIRYIYTLLSLTQNVRLSLGVALLPDSASHSVKQNPLADTRIPI
jgi:hypothetical protein